MTSKSDKRQSKSKYRQSLEMLETEEGQLNAVFACYGSAMQSGQLFEQALGDFLTKYKELTSEDLSPADLLSTKLDLQKKTIGRLLYAFHKVAKVNEAEIHSRLVDARDKRNMLAHEFFLVRCASFRTYDGRMKLLQELISVESDIQTATNLVKGMRVAVEDALTGSSCGRTGSETLFTMELNLPSGDKEV